MTAHALDPAQLEAELARLRPLAEMGRMAATVAHEIRNPLAGISANAELLRESLDHSDDVESVDIILGEVERLGHLVTDLLLYCRERDAECRATDLAWLARTTCDLAAADAERARVALTWSGQGRAQADAALARQALLNVVRNAIQATAPGGSVAVHVADACIAVRDTGCGVPESLRSSLFEPFVTGRTRGLGLGATVAKRCQERQKGDLELTATGPQGTIFSLRWPE